MKRLLTYMVAPMLGVWLLFPATASAQDDTDPNATEEEEVNPYPNAYGTDHVEARFIGLSGGIVVGAELVMTVQALAGIDKLWPYLVFPFVGAAAGGVGGFYLEKAAPPGAVALLVAGIALIIPTALATASAFAYDPEKEGAIGADADDGARFSFEQPPSKTPKPEKEGATTEVEARPEGAPRATPLPPQPSGPESETAPPAGNPGENDGTAAPPAEDGNGEAQPSGSISPSKSRPSARTLEKRRAREAARQRARAGALVYVGRGASGLSVPALDVRPANVSSAFDLKRPRTGFQLFIPILRVDLP